jgi:hypothetical protein
MNTNLNTFLLENGFIKEDKKNLSYKKKVDSLSMFIWGKKDKKFPNELLIGLGISLNDPFLTNQPEGLHLFGFLSEKGVSLPEEDSSISWKFPSEEEEIINRLRNDGFAWLNNFSDARSLIEHFENGLNLGLPNQIKKQNIMSYVADKPLFRQMPINNKVVRHPPIYNYYLSLLYYEIGDFNCSKNFATEWLNYSGSRNLVHEPDRTLRHLEKLTKL